MQKFIFNSNIHGYRECILKDFDISDKKDSLIIVIIDKTCNETLGDYYFMVNGALKNRNKVILIGIDDENTAFKPLASLMVTYNAYDIYQITSKDALSAKYMLELEKREPDLSEVQTYIGGDVTAYSDMTTILFGIESLIDEGNIDKLKTFLEEHMLSIENLTSTLNSMKKTCDMFNSNELINTVNNLKEQAKKLQDTIDNKDKTIETIKLDRDKNKVEAESLKRENVKLKAKVKTESSEEQVTNVIKTYKEVNTQLIKCRARIILYFKEISYVQYTNSLILHILEKMSAGRSLKVKLIIYDTQTSLYQVYKPLSVVSSKEYITQKDRLLTKTKAFVVSEPNQAIIEDVLTSDQVFDIVIIYDRMKNPVDVVSGNNVSKFYVINSKKDYEAVSKVLNINDIKHVITRASNGIQVANSKEKEFIDIPYIEKYDTLSTAAKQSKYMRLASEYTKKPIIETIEHLSRIDMLS